MTAQKTTIQIDQQLLKSLKQIKLNTDSKSISEVIQILVAEHNSSK